MYKRVILIVFDGLGIGSYIENENYNSLCHAIECCEDISHFCIPEIDGMGLSILRKSYTTQENIQGCYGRTRQQSCFCDSYAAHWEMAGKVVNEGVTFSDGVPQKYLDKMSKNGLSFSANEICYEDISQIKSEVIKKHKEQKKPILLTIPTPEPISTVGVVALEKVISFDDLKLFGNAMAEALKDEAEIGRIVIKSIVENDNQIIEGRHRWDIPIFRPPSNNLITQLKKANINTYATGKINSLFNGKDIKESRVSWVNETIKNDTIDFINMYKNGLIWANFNSLDRPYGHNCDVKMWIDTLITYDHYVSEIKDAIDEDDLLIITGDHGCDPTGKGHHTREWNPLLVYTHNIRPCCIGDNFHTSIFKTIAENFNIIQDSAGSFLELIEKKHE